MNKHTEQNCIYSFNYPFLNHLKESSIEDTVKIANIPAQKFQLYI